MTIFGIEDISEFCLPDSRINPSLNRNAVEIQRIINAIPESIIWKKMLRERQNNINRIKGTKTITKTSSLLTYEQRRALMDCYEDENRKVGREYFGTDESPFPPLEKPQEPENIFNAEINSLLQDVVGFFGQVLISQEQKIEKLHYAMDEFELSREIPKGCRVVVYGAGNKGRIVYHWIKRKQDYNVVGIVDKRDDLLRSVEPNVRPREDIFKMDYDYILIAVKSEKSGNDIQAWLMACDVDGGRIVRVM